MSTPKTPIANEAAGAHALNRLVRRDGVWKANGLSADFRHLYAHPNVARIHRVQTASGEHYAHEAELAWDSMASFAAPLGAASRIELTRRGRIMAADADYWTITVRMDLPIAAGLTFGDTAWVTYTAENSLGGNHE